jgi:selenoprotein W-related protein
LAAKVLSAYKQKLSGLELEPSSGGCFELSADGKLIYSKLQTGAFPDEQDMVAEVGHLLLEKK